MLKAMVFLILVPLFLLSFSTAQGKTIHVPGDSTTIQGGINGAVNGDTVLVADGTYAGDGNRDINFLGKAIVVMSENGAENCIIDCEADSLNTHRGFHFHSGEDTSSVLQGFTIQNGYAYGDEPQNRGGGIYFDDSSPTITGNTIIMNTAFAGGGIYCKSSSPIIRGNIITLNQLFNEVGYTSSGSGIQC